MTALHHPRSLFGGRLYGDRLVYLVYIDEAGISNPQHEPWLVVAGLIVHADKKQLAVSRHLDKLVRRFIPADKQDDFVFHATEIFNGGGKVFDRQEWPLAKRLEVAEALAAIPASFKLPICCGVIERAATLDLSPILKDHPKLGEAGAQHLIAFGNCAMMVEHWMRQQASDEISMLIVEDNRLVRQIITNKISRLQSRSIADTLTKQQARHFPFRKIIGDPAFQPKRPGGLLQVADFCAYVLKRSFMNRNDVRYQRFYDALWPQVVMFSPEQFA